MSWTTPHCECTAGDSLRLAALASLLEAQKQYADAARILAFMGSTNLLVFIQKHLSEDVQLRKEAVRNAEVLLSMHPWTALQLFVADAA
eukprot:4951738-Amphidinium_carterae.1